MYEYNLEGSWPYVGPQHSKKTSAFGGGGNKGPVKKAYVHRASKGSNPLGILFYPLRFPLNMISGNEKRTWNL
jgi:hypothetical protein